MESNGYTAHGCCIGRLYSPQLISEPQVQVSLGKTCAPSAAGPPILRFLKSVLPLPKFISFDSWDLQGYLLLTLAKKSSECLDPNPQNPTESSSI